MAAKNIQSTLQGIRKGAGSPGMPGNLADQIRAQQRQQKMDQFKMQQALQDQLMQRKKMQQDARQFAFKQSQQRREQMQERLQGVASKLAVKARQDPEGVRQILSQSSKTAEALGVDPNSPNLENELMAARARFTGEVSDQPKQNRLKSDLIDEQGNIKSEVSNDIRQRAVEAAGGTAQITPQGTVTTEASTEQREFARKVSNKAEKMLEQGKAKSTNQALSMALDEVEKPEEVTDEEGQANLPLPNSVRKDLLRQNQQIDSILSNVEKVREAAGEATGAVANIRSVINSTWGQLPGKGIPFEDTSKARQRLRQFNKRIERALNNDSKLAETEVERIKEFLPDPDSWFENPDQAVQRIELLKEELEHVYEKNMQDLGLEQGSTESTEELSDEELVDKYAQ